MMSPDIRTAFGEQGYFLANQVFSADEMASAIEQLPVLSGAGSRKMLDTEIGLTFARHPRVVSLVLSALGVSGARPIRGILFDKTEERNWTLGLHQDTKIAVREKHDRDGFHNWSIKEGIVHCQPPLDVLQKTVAARIHLDPCPEEAGPLMVVPGSHKRGWTEPGPEDVTVSLPCEIGDVILMSPLVLH